jgi:hypothetical protein
MDTSQYMIPGEPAGYVRDSLIGIPEYLESLNARLIDQLGAKWWKRNVR